MNFSAAKEIKLKEIKEKEKRFIEELSLKTVASLLSSNFLENNVTLEQFERLLEKSIKKLPESDLRTTLLENISSHSTVLFQSLKEKKPITTVSNNLLKRKRNNEKIQPKNKKTKRNNKEEEEEREDFKVIFSPEVTKEEIKNFYHSFISDFILNENSKEKSNSYHDQFLNAIKQIWFLSQSDQNNHSKLSSLSLSFLSLFDTLFEQHSFELSSPLFCEKVLEVIVKYLSLNKEEIAKSDVELNRKFYTTILQFYIYSNFSDSKIHQISSQIYSLIYSSIFHSLRLNRDEEIIKHLLSEIKYDQISYHKVEKTKVLSQLYYITISNDSPPSSLSHCILGLKVCKKGMRSVKGKAKELMEVKAKIGRQIKSEYAKALARSFNLSSSSSVDDLILHIVNANEDDLFDQLRSVSLSDPSNDNNNNEKGEEEPPLFFIDKKSTRKAPSHNIVSLHDQNDDENDENDDDDEEDNDNNEGVIRFDDSE